MMRRALRVVAFGDSTTAPRDGVTVYPELLQRYWQGRKLSVEVINSGVRGDHTGRALARFTQDVLAHKPDVVIIRFGINDAAVDVWETPPATANRVPLPQFRQNIVTIVEGVRQCGALPLLCTPNPVACSEITLPLYGRAPYLPDDPDGFNVLLLDYVSALRELAAQRRVPLVDLDHAFRQHSSETIPPWQSLLLDGMHPNDAGQRLAAALLIPALDALIEKIKA